MYQKETSVLNGQSMVAGVAAQLRSLLGRHGLQSIRDRPFVSRLHGQSMVETALVLPLLLLVLTGILTFGLAYNNYVLLTEATSVGARTLAISRGETTDPCSTAATAIYSAAPLLTPANMTFSFVLNGTTYTGSSCSSGSTTTGAAGNLVQGSNAVVTVTYPCSLIVYGANYAPGCNLQAQITENVQ